MQVARIFTPTRLIAGGTLTAFTGCAAVALTGNLRLQSKTRKQAEDVFVGVIALAPSVILCGLLQQTPLPKVTNLTAVVVMMAANSSAYASIQFPKLSICGQSIEDFVTENRALQTITIAGLVCTPALPATGLASLGSRAGRAYFGAAGAWLGGTTAFIGGLAAFVGCLLLE